MYFLYHLFNKTKLLDQCLSQVALVVKNPPATVGDARDKGSIPGPGRSPGEGDGNLLQYSCLLEIPWTEEPGGLWFMGSQSDWVNKQQMLLTSQSHQHLLPQLSRSDFSPCPPKSSSSHALGYSPPGAASLILDELKSTLQIIISTMWAWVLSPFSRVWLFAISWTVTH